MVPRRGIEPLFPEWKSDVLTTERTGRIVKKMVDPAGLEPATTRLWAECSDQTELWIHVYGVSGGIRTPDPRLRRALLYPAELQIHMNGASYKIWTCDNTIKSRVLYQLS